MSEPEYPVRVGDETFGPIEVFYLKIQKTPSLAAAVAAVPVIALRSPRKP